MKEHRVVQVVPDDNYVVTVVFDNGRVTRYNISPFLKKGLFQRLSDKKVFRECCRINNGTLSWDLGGPMEQLDIAPDVLYNMSVSKRKRRV